MLAYTYIEQGKFELRDKPEPKITDTRDAIVRVTLGSICTCISSTVVYRVQYPEQQSDMRW